MLSSELFWTAFLGLVIGGLGGLAVPDRRTSARSTHARRTRTRLTAPALGVGGALVGSLVGSLLLGSGFVVTRLALAGLVSVLLVCCWALYLRERSLSR